jgi:TOMM system kinase/cyclase fusion protein
MLSQDPVLKQKNLKQDDMLTRHQHTNNNEPVPKGTSVTQRFSSEQYRLHEKIGQGGFGQVYKATQLNTGQTVAIKFLTLDSDSDEQRQQRNIERFHRETSLCSRLQHPNIVRLLDKGVCDQDLVYAVFEYVEGQSLKDILEIQGPLAPSDAANIMAQVLDALAHAHSQGVIHRDLKPANIMLTKSGARDHAKILDFGIGTLTNDERKQDFKTLTLTHESLGTPSYSAPEQLRGELPTVKSDLYVWGLVFIECLTGHPAITGTTLASIFHKQLSQSNVPMPVSIAGHPLAGLLQRVLNKHTQERAGDAAGLYDRLSQINVSSLVNIPREPSVERVAELANAPTMVDFQETQVNSHHAFNTGRTERKQISALCVTLNMMVSSSEADDSGSVDHEVIDALHRDQKAQCIDIAVRYGAHHVGTLGDTLLFYFGYPSVSDNDSRLCARTALEISSSLHQRNALLKSKQGVEVQVKMGMHTGLVTCYAGSGSPEGDTANVAMELARVASPFQVLSSETSQQILDNYLEFSTCDARPLGVGRKTTGLYRLLGERSVEAFGFLRGKRSNVEFIGREKELAGLYRILKQGGSAAHVYGEAGIGKSRLVFELRDRAQNYRHYIAQALPEHQFNALHPVLSVIKHKYALDSLTPSQAVARMRDQLSGKDQNVSLALLCTWLHLPIHKGVDLTAVSADVQKTLLFNALTELLLAKEIDGPETPALFIFEDMHWSDPTSVEFLASFLQHPLFQSTGCVLISTSRQPCPDPLVTSFDLVLPVEGLDQQKTTAFIKTLFNQQNVAPGVVDLVINRTDGIPLFIEELVNMLLSRKLVDHLNGAFDFVSPEHVKEVPGTLLESLQQKLDCLVSAKDTAQLAATIGREFDYPLLVACSPKSEEEVQADLNELVNHELIVRRRQVSGDSYVFKHALVRDAAYEAMGKQQRVASHSLIAHQLETRLPQLPEAKRDSIARHFAQAECYSKAVEYGLQVMEALSELASNVEALSFGNEVECWIKQLQASLNKDRYLLRFFNLVLPTELAVNSYTSELALQWNESIKHILEEKVADKNASSDLWAEEPQLCQSLKERSEFLDFLSLHHSSRYPEAKALGEKLLARYESTEGRCDYLIPVLCFLSQNYQFEGDFHKSISSFERTIALYEDNTYPVFMEADNDFKPYCLGMLSLSYLHIGELDKAIDTAHQAVALSVVDKFPVSCVASHIFYALCLSFNGDEERVIQVCNDYYQYFYDEQNPTFYTVYIDILLETARGNLEEAKKRVLDLCNSDYDFATGWYMHFIAKKLMANNNTDDAVALMELSLEKSTNNGEVAAIPIVKNALALALFKQGNQASPRVISLLNESLELARQQRAYLFVQESEALLASMTEVVE